MGKPDVQSDSPQQELDDDAIIGHLMTVFGDQISKNKLKQKVLPQLKKMRGLLGGSTDAADFTAAATDAIGGKYAKNADLSPVYGIVEKFEGKDLSDPAVLAELQSLLGSDVGALLGGVLRKQEPVRREGERVGRNSPCSCGSGKKFKKCCMGQEKKK